MLYSIIAEDFKKEKRGGKKIRASESETEMDENSFNSVSHTAVLDHSKKHRRKRRLLLAGYILFAIAYVILFTVPVKMFPALGGLPFLLVVFYKITWWRLDYDYEYSIAAGELKVEKVYSAARRTKVVSIRIKDALEIAPLHKNDREEDNTLDLRGSEKAEDAYRVVYRNESGETAAVLIEVSTKLVKMMAKYNPKTVVVEGLRN